MPIDRIHRFLHSAIADLERDTDGVARLFGESDDAGVRVLAYAGYRNARTLRLKGRVVRYANPPAAGEGMWSRMRAMMAIYNSKELPGVAVRLDAYGASHETVSDDEGYFAFDIAIDTPLPPHTRWERVALSTPGREAQAGEIAVPVIAPGEDHRWGIISDIDDTVVETGATDFLKNWRRVLVEQPGDRLAVPGAATLYQTIARDHAAPARPFFYVSSSPWNLYGFITEFMELNGIPHGPMFLKDYGIDRSQLVHTDHEAHKLAAIREVLAFYPEFRFLLIGDNGQADIAVYARIVEEFAGRVPAVFIRDVDGSSATGVEADQLAGIAARGVRTFTGAGFADAVAVVEALGLDRPLEAARGVVAPAEATPSPAPREGAPG